MDQQDIKIDKIYLGHGLGNQLRMTHVPTGVVVIGRPIPPNEVLSVAYEVEMARLLLELKQLLRAREAR